MFAKKNLAYTLFVLVSLVALSLVYSPISQAQNWAAIAPYNTLWPLWAPNLSPINSVTGLPTPIVNELIPSTVLPIQPGLTWDPSAANPWLLYNSPLGMTYYDPIGGVNLWPPSYLQDLSGSPLPLNLPIDYGYLPPTPNSWLSANIPLGNIAAFTYLKTLGLPIPFPVPTLGPKLPPTYGGLFQAPSAYFPVAPFPYSLPAPILLPPPTTILLPPPTILLPPPTVLLPPPSALLPPPTVLLPPPTVLLPPPSALLPAPTVLLPPPTVLLPPPSALLPAPTALVPAPTAVLPAATAVPAVISGLYFPFI